MNALEHNRHTETWQALGLSLPRPRAVLAISAHWETRSTWATAMQAPRTIHDFGGFPTELSAVQYPAPGAPELVDEIATLLSPVEVGRDHHWGLDHGTWSILIHMYPEADVPVVQLSLDIDKSVAEHVALGAALAPLRDRGVLVVGSGNVVHNLRRIDWSDPDGAFDWAVDFDERARALMTTQPGDIARLAEHPAWTAAVPTIEHWLPLAYVAGLADASDATVEVVNGSYAFGSLSMTGFVVR
jgi:4,5-DOPA dioxygenase extradiol